MKQIPINSMPFPLNPQPLLPMEKGSFKAPLPGERVWVRG